MSNKQSMKLYTEEQIRKRLNSPMDDEVTIDEFIESLTHIELPSDEKIKEVSKNKSRLIYDHESNFQLGAKWMRDKIQGGNK